MTITQRERVIAQINHVETDYLPYTIRFDNDLIEGLDCYGSDVALRLDRHYGSPAWRGLVDNAIPHIVTHMLGVDLAAVPIYTDVYGSRWRVDRRPFHLCEPALKTCSLDGYQFPEVDALFGAAWNERTLRAIAQHPDHFIVMGFGLGLWERTWALRGFEQALMDAAAEPDAFEELIEQVANHQLAIIARLAELPIDGIMFADDWGYQQGVLLGPARWRRILKPRLARLYACAHQAGKYTLSHCCGSVADILPDIIEIGLDVLESVQPEAAKMNPYELKRRFGNHITFWGGLGSQSVIPFGKPEEIRAQVENLCREMGKGGGYILSPAKPLQPETPTENAAAIVESFLRQAGVTFP
ncbi:MAG: hypothetical protein HY782_05085 [Chloroflexi bacterium]|nr:hypothetical protein [Chloroflexota bacterium]